ncbi:hypothetical protein [Leifsonia sp. Leaf264]|uniref:hypothetical protein n=1 Tax=Leifsonia sp. Leaf264 TaxID=1736314 RepID=UPI0006F24B74|nr:hypothetical protein [Leifsonia sp. Leaf264]KQO99439.1 hypothetical protein ASF30_05730 [Leifsonia sp. Leaf264]
MAGTNPERRISIWATVGVIASVMVASLALSLGPLVARAGWRFDLLRNYFSYDQWGYLSIVRNYADGLFSAVEPDTQTGSNFYPHAYYAFLGLVARVTGADSIVVWNIVGIALQTVLVGFLAMVLIVRWRRPLLGLLAVIPFIIGTFAWLDGGAWFTQLQSHAVLWGPFAMFYTLNGEAASVAIAGMALLTILAVWIGPTSRRLRMWGTLLAAIAIGALGNVQTYSFITAVYLAVYVLAVYAIVSRRRWKTAIVSVVLVPVLFLTGGTVFAVGGQLPTLVFGLLPAIPGLIAIIIDSRGFVAVCGAAAALAASPQVVMTAIGIISKDPFLTFRVDSNVALGLGVRAGLLASVVLILPLVAVAVAGIVARRPLWSAYGIGAMAAWFVLASNDRWGANAEPYRIWIDAFTLIALTILPVIVDVVIGLRRRAAETESESPSRARALRVTVSVVVTVTALVAAGSAIDVLRFSQDATMHTLEASRTPRELAASALASSTDAAKTGALIATDGCVDPRYLKVNSGGPVAFFHVGMAWPEDYVDVGAVVDGRQDGSFPVASAIAGGVGWVITDSECADDWPTRYADDLVLHSSRDYTTDDGASAQVQLWSIRGDG